MACVPTGERCRLPLGWLSSHAKRIACVAMALLALVAVCREAQASRWGREYVPNVPVVTQDGKVLNFYDDLIKDKIFVISFLFTSCRDVCPIAAARMAQLQDRLGDRVGKEVFLYSISIDPENDTPDKMKKYAETFGARPGWMFLTGIPEDINLIRQRLGERSRFLGEHRNDVLLGNGITNAWQRDSLMGDMERFVTVIDAMDTSAKRAPEETGAGKVLESYEIKGPAGQSLYIKACSGCHTIGRGDRVGPDLAGITERRQQQWLVEFIASPERMRARKDPIALALTAKYPNVRMPGIGVSEDEAADLVAYIDGYLDHVDDVIFSPGFADPVNGWRKYLDPASTVDFYLIQELTKNLDSNMYTSVFMYKTRDTAAGAGKLYMGPLWDFDTAMGDAEYPGDQGDPTGWYLRDELDIEAKQTTETWFNRLFQDPAFQAMVEARWQQIYPQLRTSDQFIAGQLPLLQASANLNFQKWSVTERLEDVQVIKGSWPNETAYLRQWLDARLDWMNDQLG